MNIEMTLLIKRHKPACQSRLIRMPCRLINSRSYHWKMVRMTWFAGIDRPGKWMAVSGGVSALTVSAWVNTWCYAVID